MWKCYWLGLSLLGKRQKTIEKPRLRYVLNVCSWVCVYVCEREIYRGCLFGMNVKVCVWYFMCSVCQLILTHMCLQPQCGCNRLVFIRAMTREGWGLCHPHSSPKSLSDEHTGAENRIAQHSAAPEPQRLLLCPGRLPTRHVSLWVWRRCWACDLRTWL